LLFSPASWPACDEIDQNWVYKQKWQEILQFQEKPLEMQRTEFTAYLERLAKDRDFQDTTLGAPSGRPMENNPNFQILRYEYKFDADLADLVEFLARLDTSERQLRIERLAMDRKLVVANDYDEYPPSPMRRVAIGSEMRLTEKLSVTMIIAIPAAQPASEPAGREDSP